MNKHLARYLDSFDLDKKFWQTFLIDSIAIGLIIVLFFGFGALIGQKAYAISGGLEGEALKAQLLAGSEEYNKKFYENTKGFVIFFTIGAIVALLASLFLFSYSRKLVWQVLLEKKTKFWKWNWVVLLLGVISTIYFILASVVTLLLNFIIPITNQAVQFYYSRIIELIFLFILLIFAFITYFSFTKSSKVWETFGSAFSLFKTKWSSLWRALLFIILTGVFVTLLTYFIQKALMYNSEWQQALASGIILVLLISWIRKYIISVIKG